MKAEKRITMHQSIFCTMTPCLVPLIPYFGRIRQSGSEKLPRNWRERSGSVKKVLSPIFWRRQAVLRWFWRGKRISENAFEAPILQRTRKLCRRLRSRRFRCFLNVWMRSMPVFGHSGTGRISLSDLKCRRFVSADLCRD